MEIKNINIKNILYTTDLSDTALKAFSYAASLSCAYGAKLTILHVIEGSFSPEEMLSELLTEEQWKNFKERNIDQAKESLSGKSKAHLLMHEGICQFTENVQANEETKPFTTDEVLVLYGDEPVSKIIETSKERNSDLIVMGTHGRKGLFGDIGSTTRAVLRKSKIPVLAVRLDE
ncbi:nucleotide-binding universal stress UspA family protein [Desulfosalsimonas propionicica]|uniref:Nucleotide-binding universal stress UspA family protein n=1 Tax=Desulfosalsimonas propionicica TaxID=332175 RepID=A0A7W0CBQ9_9BACT|nr:universal stress protein [Desulfosalsimonas propionicica]MBA2882809.1 nucleotide-binding universal stress UspA family protein [Desulfosalsimonas propionicica]